MALRIDEIVLSGEIDNRVKGMVRGRVWLIGRADPVQLELAGNACPAVAGCVLTFRNPRPTLAAPNQQVLAPIQRGLAGDLTVSRKVRVLDVPVEQALAMASRGEKPPEHLANSLYLEWFSETNGRVVIESADYELAVSTPEWRMTPEDEAGRVTSTPTERRN